jgi:aryl-alcohol dehydrogenase-like predicted oxidoreductase
MIKRRLGTTNLHVSPIGIGTWQFGGEWGKEYTEKEVAAVLDAAREEGINLIDTAECYGDHLSESLIGPNIRKDRQNWIIATKFGHHYHGFQDRTRHFEAAEVEEQLDASLKALGTEYVDLYQFHSPKDEEFENSALWETLQRLREKGKIRNIGISISKNTNLFQVESAPAAGAGAIQLVYNRLDMAPESAVLPACRRLDLGVLARVPLASGFLSGKYRDGASFSKDDWRSRKEKEEIEAKIADARRVEVELPKGTPMAEWALAWVLKHPAVSCAIPGCKNPEQVRSNARSLHHLESPEKHPQAV